MSYPPFRHRGPRTLASWAFCSALQFTLAAAAVGEAPAWHQFRGPTGQGISSATNVPLRWSATNHVAWKVPVPGQGWSSPLLAHGRLYLTTATDDSTGGPSLRVLCLDAASGEIRWNVQAVPPDQSGAKALHRKNSLASATPFLKDNRLYAHFGHMGTAALDLQGKILWQQTDVKYEPVHGNGGSPIVHAGLLIFNSDGANAPFMAALDEVTGKVRWQAPRESTVKKKFSFSTPLVIQVGDAHQLISPASGYVAGYDPRHGTELWRVNYDEGYSVVPRPAFAHDLLFISSGFDHPVLYAIKPAGAAGDVTQTNVVWTHQKGVSTTPSMLVAGDELYFVSDGGIASCVDARAGTVHWSERLGGNFSASPVYAEGRIYFQNELGTGFVLKAGKTFELLAQNELGERALASYAVADGALFIRTESHLWRIGDDARKL